MKFLGLEIQRIKQKREPIPSGWQVRPADGQGPFTSYFEKWIPRKVEASFYEFLREGIPIIDAGIRRLISLEGHIIVKGNNEAIVDELRDWFENIQVNDIQKGIQAYHQNFTNEAFEQGFALSEFIANKKRTDIVGLRVADSKFIKFKRKTDGSIGIYQQVIGDSQEKELNPVNLQYFSIDNENQNPYGTSIMRSLEFICKILATMQNSLMNVWERFGDPSFSIIYKTSKKDGSDHATRRKQIENEFNTAIRAKREGKSADFIRAIDKDSDIKIDVIGANDQLLEFEVPSRHILEQVVAKFGLPPWMLGMHWSTTERLSDQEAEMLLADIKTRQSAKLPLFNQLTKTVLLLRGRTWKKGDWWLEWAQLNLHDIVKQAQARFLNAQADMMSQEVSSSAPSQPKPEDKGKAAHFTEGEKEEQRPIPWQDLDRVEDEYLQEIKYEWNELKKQVGMILKLQELMLSAKEDIPGLESFTFSIEQRALIMKAFKDWIGTFEIEDPDSPVTWYYGQAYSLGLIQAARMIGKDIPILDLIKNKEIFRKLAEDGFKLVKENATKALTHKIIPAMETHVIIGSNPKEVARVLEKLFGDKNSDWERLARSELTMAAETAKLDEWRAWKIKEVDFVPAPDACPICMALAGRYPINKCPIPVKNTHPRCRCSIVPVAAS